ncbi:peptide-N-glycosidase F-related protein [Dokdonella koreensis]|uniref:Uncharacterized protein n=1 Tax=Dokdonella koreensis DS-123 TaxID=1300342 RepID=A0A167H4H7_9GAMM|nr:hypothetical protein [Dokdonella koreensis]ANB18876.1 Hypothetical protein I596_2883 [Dokdonella koreensis DS-123]
MKPTTPIGGARPLLALVLLAVPLAAGAQTVTTTNVLTQAPQFSIYSDDLPPLYTTPPGIVLLRGNESWYTLTLLSAQQKAQLGADLAAKVTKFAGCDAFDRIESIVYLPKAAGAVPTTADIPRTIEIARFMTTFSTYNRDSNPSPYVSPLMDVSAYAPHLADPTQDIWVGFAGGSYPTYPNGSGTYNPCWTNAGAQVANLPLAPYPPGLTTEEAQAIFARTGFSFSLDLLSTQPPGPPAPGPAVRAALNAPTGPASGASLTIAGTLDVPDPGDGSTTVDGTLHLIVTTHGGNSEYGFSTGNTVQVNGAPVGDAFSTQTNCNAFVGTAINPLNGSISSGTVGANPTNPRNWCPGGPVRTTVANPGTTNPTDANPGVPVRSNRFHSVRLNVGANPVQLDLGPFVTRFGGPYDPGCGNCYPTSIVFVPVIDALFDDDFEAAGRP